MSPVLLYALGALSVAALLVSGALLWRQLRGIPTARRLVNMLMPVSQIVLVVCVFALGPYFAHWEMIALVVAPVGIVAALLNPLFYKSLLDAERADTEAERVAFLEDQLAAQRQYAVLMQRKREEAARVRDRLDERLSRIEGALAVGDEKAARAHLADAERAMRPLWDRRCQHPVVDALLSAKAAWCAKERIPIEMTATVPSDLPTPDVELCALFANAFDNAIHACLQVPEGLRRIRVRAHPAHGHFLLEVENSCALEDDVRPHAAASSCSARDGIARHDGGSAGNRPQYDGDSADNHSQREGAVCGQAQCNGSAGSRSQHGSLSGGGLAEHGHGLAIMREIVARHDGEIVCKQEVAPEQGCGKFSFSAIWKL